MNFITVFIFIKKHYFKKTDYAYICTVNLKKRLELVKVLVKFLNKIRNDSSLPQHLPNTKYYLK
jgi:hypothetical protein